MQDIFSFKNVNTIFNSKHIFFFTKHVFQCMFLLLIYFYVILYTEYIFLRYISMLRSTRKLESKLITIIYSIQNCRSKWEPLTRKTLDRVRWVERRPVSPTLGLRALKPQILISPVKLRKFLSDLWGVQFYSGIHHLFRSCLSIMLCATGLSDCWWL